MNPETHKTFSITQVSEKTGVSKNRIREWHEKGFLPEVQSFVLQIAVKKAREDGEIDEGARK